MKNKNLYLRPLSSGEIRVTSEATENYDYIPIRASGYFFSENTDVKFQVNDNNENTLSTKELLIKGKAVIEVVEANIEILKQYLSLLTDKVESDK